MRALPATINGLPTHVLLVHAVVVLIPLAAVSTILSAVWPAARRRLGAGTPVTALIALVLVPVTTSAGGWLRDRVPDTALVRRHAELGDQLLPFAACLFVLAALVWMLDSNTVAAQHLNPKSRAAGRTVTAVVAVLAVAASVAVIIQTYRIGDSGAQAAWHGRVRP